MRISDVYYLNNNNEKPDADKLICTYIKDNNPLSKIMIDCLMYYKKSGYYRDIVCREVITRDFGYQNIEIDNRSLIRRWFNFIK